MHQTISHYRVLEPLGSGGAGQVWKAEDLRLKRAVAIKSVATAFTRDETARERLQNEARMAAALTHPNIATIYELIEAGDQFYIVMEFVEGETLKSRNERAPFDIIDSLEIAIQVADALNAAHARGLLHCDIKSSNLLISPEGRVKVLDFGLAQITRPIRLSDDLSSEPAGYSVQSWIGQENDPAETVVCGTLGYMSPEQVRGEPLDSRTDIFSLGAVLYEMLTAKQPFVRERAADVFYSILHDEPTPLSTFRDDVPLELEGIIRSALAKDRNERYQSVEDFLTDLRALKAGLARKSTLKGTAVAEAADRSPATQSSVSSKVPAAGRSLRALASQGKTPLLVVGLLAASMAVWNIASLRPHGVEWAGPVLLFTIVALCAVGLLAARYKVPRPSHSMPSGAAFRGLLPFQEADRRRFYGRETETAALFEMIRNDDFRFGVVFGESGCGKTSLIRAGLLPKLWEQGYVPLYCRSYNDPLAAALEECRRRSQVIAVEGEPPIEYLRRAARELDATLVVVCDQFEEFFVSHKSAEKREPFLSFVAACHDASGLAVKFLFSIRSDFLYLISAEFEGRIPDPLMSSRLFHLRNFGEQQAAEIIERSVEHANLTFEPGLSHQVAGDLAVEGAVLPSELQIVGERLQNKRIFTIREYRRLGGKEPLVESFLEDTIQASGDREACGLLLRALISDDNTRLTLSLQEIARRTQRSHQSAERILNLLVAARLVREIQDETPWRYELIHEYLIEKINQITGKVMDATQRANRLFRQYLSNYSVDRRTRVPITKLWFIRRYSDLERHERERELLRKSLRWGTINLAALILVLAMGATAFAAWLSVNGQWEGIKISDGHTAAVRQAVFSPDGKLLVSCGEDKKIIVWDFVRRERLATLADHTGWVTSVAFSPDGKWFASASADQTVIIWDAARLERAVVLTGHQASVNAVAFSPDGNWLASASGAPDERTIVWSVGRWEKFRELPLGMIWSDLLFSKDSRSVGSAGAFWDVSTGQQLTDTMHPGEWRSLWGSLSPDGTRMASIDSLGIVYFWDMTRRTLISSQKVHRDHGRAIAFSPDGRLAASGAEDIILWDAATQTKLVRFEHTSIVWRVAFSPDSRWLVSTHGDGSILLWDVAERERVANFNEHSGATRAVAFSSDGRRIASASDDRSIIIWDTEQRRKEAVLVGHRTRVLSVAFSPDGKSVVSGDQDGKLILWDVDLRRPRWATEYLYEGRFFSPTYCVTISPDGRWVADSLGIYDSADGRLDTDFVGSHTGGQIYGADYSDDGRRLVCVTPYGQIYLWDAENWQLLEMLKLGNTQFISVSFSPDGKWLVTGEDEGAVRLWQADPLRQVAVIGRHTARIKSVAFSPDGKEVASAGDDQTIALWNVARRSLISRVGTHTAPVLSLAFSPDGKRLASGDHDGSVNLYTRHRMLWGFRLD